MITLTNHAVNMSFHIRLHDSYLWAIAVPILVVYAYYRYAPQDTRIYVMRS